MSDNEREESPVDDVKIDQAKSEDEEEEESTVPKKRVSNWLFAMCGCVSNGADVEIQPRLDDDQGMYI